MKIKKGQRAVKVPPIGQLISVTFDDHSLWAIGPAEMGQAIARADEKDQPLGYPAYVVLIGDELIVHPFPNRDGTLKVRYFPPMLDL